MSEYEDKTGASEQEFRARIAPFEDAPIPAEVLLSHLDSVRAALAPPVPAPHRDVVCPPECGEHPWLNQ